LFPPYRNRLVPWTVWEILIVVFLIYLFLPSLIRALLDLIHFFPWLYGDHFAQSLDQSAGARERAVADFRVGMWISALSFPFCVAAVLGVCGLASGTRPYQLGVTTHRWGRNLFAGLLGAAATYPLHVLYRLLVTGYQRTFNENPAEHPLTQLAQNHPLGIDKLMIVQQAILIAPVSEELIFRGMLQPWLGRRRWGGESAVLLAIVLAILRTREPLFARWVAEGWKGLALGLLPAAFVLLMAPGILLVRRLSPRGEAAGIYGTALLFAAAHSPVWPSPVALFPLGLVLGWLAYRTRSLVGPMVLHAVFNGIACVEMFV
jgi:membrane protease YdiL (CAAX protease family)